MENDIDFSYKYILIKKKIAELVIHAYFWMKKNHLKITFNF